MSKWIGYETGKNLWDAPGLRFVPVEAREALAARRRKRGIVYNIIMALILLGLVGVLETRFDVLSGYSPQVILLGCAGVVVAMVALKLMLFPSPSKEDRIRRALKDRPCWQCGCSLVRYKQGRCPECGCEVDRSVYEAIEMDLQTGASGSLTDREALVGYPVLSLVPEVGLTMLERKWRESNIGQSSSRGEGLLPALLGGTGIALSLGMEGSAMEEREKNLRLRFCHDTLAHRPCWQCGHSLVNLESGRCPKCDTPFDVAEFEAIEAEMAESRRNQS